MPFSVTCPSCGKSFQLAQEIYERKVAGKIVSIKCKQCQAGIRIDATESGTLKVIGSTPAGVEATAPTGALAARARQATLIGMMGPSGKPVTVSTNESGALWAVDAGGAGDDRELDDATIAREIGSGAISAETLVWRDGMGDWLEISKIPELAKHLPSAKKPEPAKVAAPLPGARGKQPSAPEVAAAAPAPAPVKAPAPAVNPAPVAKAPAPVAKAPAPAAPTAKAPAAKAPTPAAKAATPAIPSMVSEDDDEEATMIFRSPAEAAAKLGLDAPASEEEAAPAAPRPAAGRPVVAAPLPAAGRPAAPAAKAPSAPLNPTPAAKAPSAPLNPAPAARAPSAPLNAPPPLPAAPAPAPPPLEPAAAPAPPPPPRARQPSAPGLPRGLTPPEPPPAPPPPPSPPPPPAADEPAAALPPVRPRQQSAPVWPRGLTPPPDRPAPLGGAPTPPPTAPPFMPTQNPFAAGSAGAGQMAQLAPNPFAVATTTDLDYAPPRSKTPLLIGGIVLVLAAAGAAFAVMGSGAHPPPPPVPAAAPTAPPPAPIPTPTQEAQTGETPAPPAHPSDDIAGAPHPSASSGDFSQLFAAGAEKAQKGGTSGASTKTFDAEAAKTAVAAVLKLVAACKEPGGPTGQSSAAVTFDASGHVSSVTIGAPFSGTSTGTCIIGAFKNASMSPFTGLPGTIAQPVSLL